MNARVCGHNDAMPSVLWFRRDLRLTDLPSLVAAADGDGDVLACFVLDPRLEASSGPRRLQFLDLEANLHTGTIPTELAFLADLEELTLGGNALVGPVPGALISLGQVRVLSFAENSLNGTVPTELGPRVQILSLHQNQFTGTIPKFGNVTSLIELRLNENKLTGTLPTELGLLRSL